MFLFARKQTESQVGGRRTPGRRMVATSSLCRLAGFISGICFSKRLIPDMFRGGKHQAAVHAAAYNEEIFMARDRKVTDARQVHVSPTKPR